MCIRDSPKDRYYLYRSLWNKNVNTLHVLPHWTWPGREGENTPVFVYTNYPAAELFVNGKSYGKQHKLTVEESKAIQGKDALALQRRYRLMWMDVPYEPGEVKVVAYDASGKIAEEKVVRDVYKRQINLSHFPLCFGVEPDLCVETILYKVRYIISLIP